MSRLLTYQVHDCTATLRVDAPSLAARAADLHSCARVADEVCQSSAVADLIWRDDGSGGFAVDLFGAAWETGLSPESVFFQSENLLTQIFSERHGDKLQLHAGGVVAPDGKAWIIAGDSGSGKTSFTLAFMLGGWKWLSDEMIMVSEGSRDSAIGFPRNFNIKETSFPRFPETVERVHGVELFSSVRNCRVRFIDPEVLAPGTFVSSAALGGILFPTFEEGLPAPEIVRCGERELSAGLLENVFRGQPWGIEWILETARRIPAWKLRCGDPRETVGWLSNRGLITGWESHHT